MTKEEITICKMYLEDLDRTHDCNEYKLLMGLLEQQPSDDKVVIVMNKGTLKYSGQGYVAYKKDWFRKHFATEVGIMTYFDGYRKEQEKTKSSVPLSEIYRVIAGHSDYHGDNILAALTCIAEGKEVDTVKPLSQPTSDDSVSRAEAIEAMTEWYSDALENGATEEDPIDVLNSLPPVKPNNGTCKNCKKCDFEQSDQTYFCKPYGNFVCSSHYCKDFEKQGNEND